MIFYVPSIFVLLAGVKVTCNNILTFILLGVWAYSAGEVDHRARNLYTIAEEDTCRSTAQH
jgi:hypothetical protein